MLPGLEMMACTDLAVPAEVMKHVVRVESSFNPYAIGVVGGRLARQPKNLGEAVSTSRMLEEQGYNFSIGIAQVNRYNLRKQGLNSYEQAFGVCPNLQAGSRILAECYGRSGKDWGKAFSCYYSGNFTTGYRHGYVDKVMASWRGSVASAGGAPIPVIRNGNAGTAPRPVRYRVPVESTASRVLRRVEEAALASAGLSVGGNQAGYADPRAGAQYPASDVYPQSQAAGVYPESRAAEVYPPGMGAGTTRRTTPAPSRAQPLGAGAHDPTATDAPVVLQPMGAPPVSQPATVTPGTLPPAAAARDRSLSNTAPAAAQPERDAAFVF